LRSRRAPGCTAIAAIVVNDTLQTFDPRVYAIGECVAHRGSTYGLVAPLFEMAKVCGEPSRRATAIARYAGSQVSTKLKVTGVDLFSAGDFTGGKDTDEIVLGRSRRRRVQEARRAATTSCRRRAVRRHLRTAHGTSSSCATGAASLASATASVFGEANLGDTGTRDNRAPFSMADDARCALQRACAKALSSRPSRRRASSRSTTCASTPRRRPSCGSCTGLVEQLLMATAGGDYSRAGEAEGRCAAARSHAPGRARRDPRPAALVDSRDHALPRVAHAQRLRDAAGRDQLLPHLDVPKDAWTIRNRASSTSVRTPTSRRTARIPVIPRMWGRRDECAPSFRASPTSSTSTGIRTVKVTGGQRIDLLGVKKADLPAVWADLDMPSGTPTRRRCAR
jgi:nitrite reductase (NADH) large subunit